MTFDLSLTIFALLMCYDESVRSVRFLVLVFDLVCCFWCFGFHSRIPGDFVNETGFLFENHTVFVRYRILLLIAVLLTPSSSASSRIVLKFSLMIYILPFVLIE